MQVGWLIEYGDSPVSAPLYYSIIDRAGKFQPDHLLALRLARQEDAEALATTFGVTPIRIAEHSWV